MNSTLVVFKPKPPIFALKLTFLLLQNYKLPKINSLFQEKYFTWAIKAKKKKSCLIFEKEMSFIFFL